MIAEEGDRARFALSLVHASKSVAGRVQAPLAFHPIRMAELVGHDPLGQKARMNGHSNGVLTESGRATSPLLPGGGSSNARLMLQRNRSSSNLLKVLQAMMPVISLLSGFILLITLLVSQLSRVWFWLDLVIFALAFRFVSLYAAFSPEPRMATLGLLYTPFLLMPCFSTITGMADGKQVQALYDQATEERPRAPPIKVTRAAACKPRQQLLAEAQDDDLVTQHKRYGLQAAKLLDYLSVRHGSWMLRRDADWWHVLSFIVYLEVEIFVIGMCLAPLVIQDGATRLALRALEGMPEEHMTSGEKMMQARLRILGLISIASESGLQLIIAISLVVTGATLNESVNATVVYLSVACSTLSILIALLQDSMVLHLLAPSAEALKEHVHSLMNRDEVASYVLARAVRAAVEKMASAAEMIVAIDTLQQCRMEDVMERKNLGAQKLATLVQLKAEGYVPIELKVVFTAGELKLAGFSAADLNVNKAFSATELYGTFTAGELRQGGYTGREVFVAGYSCADAKAGGYTCAEVKAGSYTCEEAKKAGFLEGLAAAGYTCEEAKAAGYVEGLASAGYTVSEAASAGFLSGDIYRAGYSCTEAKSVGFDAGECRNAGFDISECKDAGFDASACAKAGFQVVEAASAGFSVSEIRQAFNIPDNLLDSWDAGFNESELVAAGFRKEIGARLCRALEARANEDLVHELITPETAMEMDEHGRLPLHLAAQNRSSESVIVALLAAYPEAIRVKTQVLYTRSTLIPSTLCELPTVVSALLYAGNGLASAPCRFHV